MRTRSAADPTGCCSSSPPHADHDCVDVKRSGSHWLSIFTMECVHPWSMIDLLTVLIVLDSRRRLRAPVVIRDFNSSMASTIVVTISLGYALVEAACFPLTCDSCGPLCWHDVNRRSIRSLGKFVMNVVRFRSGLQWH